MICLPILILEMVVLYGQVMTTPLIENYLEPLGRYPRQVNEARCRVPRYQSTGRYRVRIDNNNRTEALEDGTYVNPYTFLFLECFPTYKRTPLTANFSVCLNGLWHPELNCERTCPTLTSSESTNIRCFFNGSELETCDNPLHNTRAESNCEPYYELPLLDNPSTICINGEWNGVIYPCVPICGEKRYEGTPNIINGTNVVKGSYPWHAGIYTNTQDYICGGSILSQRIILTAAHCLADGDYGTPLPKNNYRVAVGKNYRQFHDSRDRDAQYPRIQDIHIPEQYRGELLNHENDIAVIVLAENLIISNAIQPICVDWATHLEFEQLTPGSYGIVTGWGYTQESGQQLSDELKELSVPYIPFSQCFNTVPRGFHKYVRIDKFCGGYLDHGTSICLGDSGGALVFRSSTNGKYYIRGIVSTSPAKGIGQCDSNQYGLFTLVSAHLSFVNNLYTANRPLPSTKKSATALPLSINPLSISFYKTCKIPKYLSSGQYEYKILNTDGKEISKLNIPPGSILQEPCQEHYNNIYSPGFQYFTCNDSGDWNHQMRSPLNISQYLFFIGSPPYNGERCWIGDLELESCGTFEYTIWTSNGTEITCDGHCAPRGSVLKKKCREQFDDNSPNFQFYTCSGGPWISDSKPCFYIEIL